MFDGRTFLMLTVTVILANSFDSYAQSEAETIVARNTLYVEFGGNSGQYAFNYGRIFHQKGAFKLNGSAGFSFWADPIEGSTSWNPVLPLEVSGLIGRRNHHLELGIGITPYLEAEINSSFESGTLVQTKGPNNLAAMVPIRIGYRY